jgi:hypothetical protein
MFEHLDDPAGATPGASEISRVLQRASAIRRHRMATATVAFLILILGSIGFLIKGPTSQNIANVETAYQFNAEAVLPVGTPVPTTALFNVVFANAQDGFALAIHRDAAILAVSIDGGSTWEVQNDHLPAGYGEADGYPGQFEFIGTTGYLWGGTPSASGSAPVWVTFDDGITWHAAPIGPLVYDVSAIGANVWALTGSCHATPTGDAAQAPCSVGLEQSPNGGRSWSAIGLPGFTSVSGGALLDERVELARITLTRAYVLTVPVNDPFVPVGLVYSSDGGQAWYRVVVPCSGAFNLGAEVAASSTDDLWLLCGAQGSGGFQSKDLYRSGDGGLSWILVASASGLGTQPSPLAQAHQLPLAGYVAPYSVGHKNLAIANGNTAWLYPSRATLYKTENGGDSWSEVPGLDTAGFESGGLGNVTFISDTQGWICAYGVGLWHTTDGVHWSPLGI